MEVWQTILIAFGGNAVLLAVLAWAAKSLTSQWLTKDIERFKISVKSDADAASERLKNELQMSALEHQVKFSKLHEKRADVIAELYGFLVQACWDISSFVSPMEWSGEPNKQEKYVTAMNSVARFYQFFDKHRIYIPEGLCGQLDEFVQGMRQKAIGFGVYVRYEDEALPDSQMKDKHNAWTEAWKHFEDAVPETKSALETHLRSLLGESQFEIGRNIGVRS